MYLKRVVKDLFGDVSASLSASRGMTLVELLVTMLIVMILSTTLGVYFVKLLTIQEQEREEGYVRERLVDICSTYADFLSIASSISNVTDTAFVAGYRQETGGVSLETGRVSRVTHLKSSFDATSREFDFDIGHYEGNNYISHFARAFRGDALLMNTAGDLLPEVLFTPLNVSAMEDAALFYLKVTAKCKCQGYKGKTEYRRVTAGRIVRLWNKE